MESVQTYLESFLHITLLVGTFLFAVLTIYFGWNLIFYATSRGDDMHRAHTKAALMQVSLVAIFLMVLWWVVSAGAKYFGI